MLGTLIRVVKVPEGEDSSLRFRKAWLGAELTAHDAAEEEPEHIVALGGPITADGLVVHIDDALSVLNEHDKPAAIWWRKKLSGKHFKFLFFEKAVCQKF